MSFVVDASVAYPWFFPAGQEPGKSTELAARLARERGIVPLMFWAEMLQLFVVAERRDRGGRYDIPGGIAMLEALPLETDTDTLTTARTATITLARRHRLSIFDATYLELAIRRALPLATFDAALQRAAAAEHLTLLT